MGETRVSRSRQGRTMVIMSDVAKLANVSMQTVSRVINGKDQVSSKTKAAVDAAIEQLGYRPNTIARALASRRSGRIGLINTGVAARSLSKRMLSFNEAARESGYQVSIVSIDDADYKGLLDAFDSLLQQNVEGIVVIAADRDLLGALQDVKVDVPLVISEGSSLPGLHSVSVDQFLGARIATRHLLDLGHREIRHITGPPRSLDAIERLRGWRTELFEAGIASSEPLVGDWRPLSGYEAGVELAKSLDFTAVFCGNDQMVVGLLHAFFEAGIRVPEDVSIVGFDDIPEAAHLIPPLTTIRQDFDELGRRIMSTLIAEIDGTELTAPDRSEPELIIRQSTRPYAPSSQDGVSGSA
jgi:DNA-binding LacI/PurR family transcriptional regulator